MPCSPGSILRRRKTINKKRKSFYSTQYYNNTPCQIITMDTHHEMRINFRIGILFPFVLERIRKLRCQSHSCCFVPLSPKLQTFLDGRPVDTEKVVGFISFSTQEARHLLPLNSFSPTVFHLLGFRNVLLRKL